MDKKENDLNAGSTCKYVRALDANGNSIKISVEDFMQLVPGISLAFKVYGLPSAGINIVGNPDGCDSGYGWYNNTGIGSNDYAPGGSAGLFIRFNANIAPVTFFLITSGRPGELWWRHDGDPCYKMSI